ncbi:hypothetical protein M427DRAFT_67216 [Gonapodya prolifera JEL478]|uniref:Endonuclease/exonuclease/phosphatase domain-containing protein n=1 Tax=Gonapodya prolifera (strain JEL478) TaxID=1344416 RepID=A0A139ASD8_GONPJ|nr:hypothetical protein M427DRAFT_67216 [Gonapodya prolifera JEL478]|eukprot:KXS19619.1 hypothetical protein M427DRAFT_67216 [Gonapodya prolifera JEL478]
MSLASSPSAPPSRTPSPNPVANVCFVDPNVKLPKQPKRTVLLAPSFVYDSQSDRWVLDAALCSCPLHSDTQTPSSTTPSTTTVTPAARLGDRTSFTFLTWNVLWALNPPNSRAKGAASGFDRNRLNKVLEAVVAWAADVIALQEVSDYFLPTLLSHPFVRNYHSSHSPITPTSPFGSPVLLSRFPFLSSVPRIGGKDAVVAHFPDPQAPLAMWNVHLTGGPSAQAAATRTKQVARVVAHLNDVVGDVPGTGRVVMGDLNSDPAAVEGWDGYGDAWMKVKGTTIGGGTYNAQGRLIGPQSEEVLAPYRDLVKSRLDAVMVGEGGVWEVDDVDLVGTEAIDGVWMSDHFGILGRMRRRV